uniref:Replication protein A3 n=2 Tax=Timema TaxID=61471 RepID=A0A7R9G694_TIMSH|nr:unnamed protein product [Timema douglasi]CAD7266993.1 unnamed protein product [Timema shepardi]
MGSMDNSEIVSEPRMRVNGRHLAQFIGKPISIIGEVIKVNPNGMSLEISAVDDQRVIVNLTQPLDEPLCGLIEVRGKAHAKNIIVCDHYLVFPPEFQNSFDKTTYNNTIVLLHAFSNPFSV